MSNASPNGHDIRLTLAGSVSLGIDFGPDFLRQLGNFLGDLFGIAANSAPPNTACDTDISNGFNQFAFPNNDLVESGDEPNTHEQDTNVLHESTLFGRFDEDNTEPPAEHTTNMLDVLGGWATTFFTGNPEFASLASKAANHQLFSEALAGKYDIAGAAWEVLRLLSDQYNLAGQQDDAKPKNSGQTEDNTDVTDVTDEPHINVWDRVITTASAERRSPWPESDPGILRSSHAIACVPHDRSC